RATSSARSSPGFPRRCGFAALSCCWPAAFADHALAIGRNVEAPPRVAFCARLHRPVAASAPVPLAVERQRVLHHRAGLVHGGRPRFGFGQQFHFRHRPAQRQVAFIGIIAALRRERYGGKNGEQDLSRPSLLVAIIVGLLVAVQSFCLYSAVARIPVALALLVFATFAVLYILLCWVLGKEAPPLRALAAVPVAFVGLALALDVRLD